MIGCYICDHNSRKGPGDGPKEPVMPLTTVPEALFSKGKQGSKYMIITILPLNSEKDGLRGGDFSDRVQGLSCLFLLLSLLVTLLASWGEGLCWDAPEAPEMDSV